MCISLTSCPPFLTFELDDSPQAFNLTKSASPRSHLFPISSAVLMRVAPGAPEIRDVLDIIADLPPGTRILRTTRPRTLRMILTLHDISPDFESAIHLRNGITSHREGWRNMRRARILTTYAQLSNEDTAKPNANVLGDRQMEDHAPCQCDAHQYGPSALLYSATGGFAAGVALLDL
ncbi:hypothetical protein NLI96_g5799 [Meripilus lineatus]|uniref:Uncharacterized protein n=1 Tax=Meripilus lineatus TaxID=2056292 RepID=A0AAD5YDK0_9APHY|nr:hypothetical protein NLI96_g5799 [Physisporinus lineatus]